MFDFERPNIEVAEISEDKKYGRFVVEPLERGYGITLGNSLRRIMLSSLPGAAVSQVKIEGVLHEFSSIDGVKEDVTEIIMNIKSVAIKNNSDTNEPKTAYIEYEGEGVVKASDIQCDQDIEILNPDQTIATLSGKNTKLYMELTINKGRGYVSADKNKTEDLPIGVIAVDSIYTPVERVNVTVENTRVGQITDFDKLTLDVYTNGTLDPDEAVSLAAKVLSEHLNLFINLSENAKTAEIMVEKEPLCHCRAHRRTDQSLCVACHKIDICLCRELCRADHISLILPVRVICHENDLSRPQIFDRFFDCVVLFVHSFLPF